VDVIDYSRSTTDVDVIDYSRSTRGRRHAWAMLLVAILVVLAFQLFPLQNLILVSGDRTLQVRSTFGDQEDALDAAALGLGPGDRVVLAKTGDYSAFAVQRAVPVFVSADGAEIEVVTRARTVAGVLALANINVRSRDRVYVNGQRITPGEPIQPREEGTVSAARKGDPIRIEVVRALPNVPGAEILFGQVTGEEASPLLPLEAVSARRVLSVLVDPLPGLQRETGLPPETEVLLEAFMALPKMHEILVNIGGRVETMRTHAVDVSEVLSLLQLELGQHDRISHELQAPVTEEMSLVVVLVDKVVEDYIGYTAPRIYRRDDHTLAPGEERLLEGQPGEVRFFEEVVYENGVEVSRELQSSVVLSEPVSGERLRGPVARDGVSPVVVDDYEGPYTKRLRVWATWYNATHGGKEPDHPAYGITYSGLYLVYGLCAVDPDYIPLGTRFYVPGYGECLAADIGGLINGYDVDLGFPEGHAPMPWHTGYVHIYILD